MDWTRKVNPVRLEIDGLRNGGAGGFHNHTVIAAVGFERYGGAAVGERGAAAVDVVPADFGELAVMRVGPDDRLERVVAAPRTARPHRRWLVVIRLDGIGGAAEIPIDDFRRALLDVINIEEVDAAQG